MIIFMGNKLSRQFLKNNYNLKVKKEIRILILLILLILSLFVLQNCKKETDYNNWVISNYNGSYKNINYSENLIKEYTSGIYGENEIPDDILNLRYGRIEIDFLYNGGALNSFMPLLYFGSINKNNEDNGLEEPQFHLAVEIGHYNVIPFPVEYLFYTISTYRQPQYCRDTYLPVKTGINYTISIDKRPEGIILQLKEKDKIINIFPHAFFPDSSQMFFEDVTSYIDLCKGDSLKKVLMVGKGFAGFDKGIHEFNGQVSGLRVYKYLISDQSSEYEMEHIRNQHTENQQVSFVIRDNLHGNENDINLKYEFHPCKFISGLLIPDGPVKTIESFLTKNNTQLIYNIEQSNLGFYKIHLETVDYNGNIIGYTQKPFEVWVYPKEWEFEFY
jgi:hypothetical protein